MLKGKYKKLFLVVSIIFAFFIIVSLLLVIINLDNNSSEDYLKTTKEIENQSIRYEAYINKSQFNRSLTDLNNLKLDENNRYKALENITFFFSVAYSFSHIPEIRTYVYSLNDFAKKYFPKNYNSGSFDFLCSDPSCGEKIDSNLENIISDIKNAGIDPHKLNTIEKNLMQSIYIPKEQTEEKQYGFQLVYNQLLIENNPKASVAAETLKEFISKKYNIKVEKLKPLDY